MFLPLNLKDFLSSQVEAAQIAQERGVSFTAALNSINRSKQQQQQQQQQQAPLPEDVQSAVIQAQLQKIAAVKAKLGQMTRKDLPQVTAKQIEGWGDVPANKLKFVDPKTLKMTQKELNDTKVQSIANDWANCKAPVIISRDNWVLDGHHRVAAAKRKNKWVRVIQVQMSANAAIKKINQLLDK